VINLLYTNLTKKAMKIAFEAHKEQVDKTGVPYIYHPIHLAEQMDDEASICVALMHDVVEDTDTTFEDLEKEGFTKEIIDALRLLTHDDSVPYLDYVKEIKQNPIATKVKLADLNHNSDLSRLDSVDVKAMERLEKYKKSIAILTEG
jgi:(p)ppGpp synthase/HD superfamily hydrolase